MDSKKVLSKLEKIKEAVNKNGKYIYYMIDSNKIKLVSSGMNLKDTKKRFRDRIMNKDKYINNSVYEVTIKINKKYVSDNDTLIKGLPIVLHIKQYHITDKYNIKYRSIYKNGAVWFSNQEIINNKFKLDKIKYIIKKIHDDDLDILNLALITYSDIM